jgi:NAD(P)-dependent dehydrogenase (short-subunit alcohol dehydrogenase family)
VGGSDVAAGEALFAEVRRTFFGPMRVSVMLDPNGANTTAAAAVLAAQAHVPLAGSTALVLGATGPVGRRVAHLLAAGGAHVRVASRSLERARSACEAIAARLPSAQLSSHAAATPQETAAAAQRVPIVIAAGAPGVELMSADVRRQCRDLRVAIDLNAVPPAGLAGVDPRDHATPRDGVACYGALGVGAAKMKIHKAAIQRLFESNDHVLDVDEIFALARSL